MNLFFFKIAYLTSKASLFSEQMYTRTAFVRNMVFTSDISAFYGSFGEDKNAYSDDFQRESDTNGILLFIA
jgi:hypothetical protein